MPSSVDAKRLAHERAATRRRAVLKIRRTVVLVSVTVFIALFSTIYIQLAAGRDPALTAASQSGATSTATSSSSGSSSSTNDSSSEDEDSADGSTSEDSSSDDSSVDESVSEDSTSDESADQPSAVTTTQS
jgi:cytoskeletal protein RodZ